MKVLICGDRNWTDRGIIRSWIAKLQDWGYTTVIEGEARGADKIAGEEASNAGMEVISVPANWEKFGRAAGIIRNRAMLDMNPDLVLAFHSDLSASKGTADTVREARRRNMSVIVETGKLNQTI